jgi:hypothetical protein
VVVAERDVRRCRFVSRECRDRRRAEPGDDAVNRVRRTAQQVGDLLRRVSS